MSNPVLCGPIAQLIESLIGETISNLSFGIEAIIPMEIGLSSYQVESCNEQANVENLHVGLDLLDEAKEWA